MNDGQRYLPQPPPLWEEEERVDPDENSWLIIYLDVLTLMICVFVMLLAYSSYAPQNYEKLINVFSPRVEILHEVEKTPEVQEEAPPIEEAPSAKDKAERLQESFQQVLLEQNLEQEVEVVVESDRVNLQIRENILFSLGLSDLTAPGMQVLGKLVPLLNSQEHMLSVEGHTDPLPIDNERFPSNWELSTERATRVLRYLISRGVAAGRLRAIGYADTQPIADNQTEEGRARNRRVSLVIHMSSE